jgi:tryptophanyl-tRNA synthetase
MREHYQALIADPAKIEDILMAGAVKARALATPLMAELRQAVGLRRLAGAPTAAVPAKAARTALPTFKQYREADGRFRFKLLDADGTLLLQSRPYGAPRDAAQAMGALQQPGTDLATLLADCAEGPGDRAAIAAALQALAAAKA